MVSVIAVAATGMTALTVTPALRHLHRPGADHADDAGLGRGVVGLAEVAALAGRGADRR